MHFLGLEDPLEEEMATCSSVFAWKIPWTEEPGGLQCIGSLESDTNERLSTHTHACVHSETWVLSVGEMLAETSEEGNQFGLIDSEDIYCKLMLS